MKTLPRPIPRFLGARTALPLVAAFLALGSVVHASIRRGSHRRANEPAFAISGGLRAPLRPGGSQPVDLALVNRTESTLWITALRVTIEVDATHAAAGCSATRDFLVAQLPDDAFPIAVLAGRHYTPTWPARFGWQPRRAWPLSALGVKVAPSVTMPNLAENQDPCKNAQLRLSYTGTARKSRPGTARRH
jgi:hypothetical protein